MAQQGDTAGLRWAVWLSLWLGGLSALPMPVSAWSLQITGAGRRLYLHVGDGTLENNNSNVNRVSVVVPAAQLGRGALVMNTNSGQRTSLSGVTNRVVCPTPITQLHIGASFRRNGIGNAGSALLSVQSPSALVSASAQTIPIGQISWTASAPGSPNPNVIPGGTFAGGTQFLASVPEDTYVETCHTFTYANGVLPAAGTYNARVFYTLSNP